MPIYMTFIRFTDTVTGANPESTQCETCFCNKIISKSILYALNSTIGIKLLLKYFQREKFDRRLFFV